MIRGEDLFSKSQEDNLSVSSLKRAKKRGKAELDDVVAANLPLLVEYVMEMKPNDIGGKWYKIACNIVTWQKCFLDPITRILAKNKKKKNDVVEIPKGLPIVLKLGIDELARLAKPLRQKNNNSSESEFEAQKNDDLLERIESVRNSIEAINEVLLAKTVKKITKVGFDYEVANRIALNLVPSKYLTEGNVGRYFRDFTDMLVNVVYTRKEDLGEDEIKVLCGIDISKPNVLEALITRFFNKVDRGVFIAALVAFMLERRRNMNNYTNSQKKVYEAITNIIVDILSGHVVINYTGENLKSKELAKLSITKKELKSIMKTYAKRRTHDSKHKRDSARRIVFAALDEERHEKLLKAFRKCVNDINEDERYTEIIEPENKDGQKNSDQKQGNGDKKNQNNQQQKQNKNRKK